MRKTKNSGHSSRKPEKAPDACLLKTLVFCAALVLTVTQHAGAARQIEGALHSVIDGNTIEVNVAGSTVQVKLWGIDAPEPQQPFGPEARDFLTRLLEGKKLRLQAAGPQSGPPFIAEVFFLDGIMRSANREMIRNGLAWSRSRTTDTLETLARRREIGLWSHNDPIKPWLFREQEARRRREALEIERRKKEEKFEQKFLQNYFRTQDQPRTPTARAPLLVDTVTRISTFNGITWGSRAEDYDRLEYVEHNRLIDEKNKRATYRMKNETMRIADVNLTHVYYYFYSNQFLAAAMTYTSRTCYQNLNDAFTQRYGNHRTVSGDYRLWIVEDLSISTDWDAIAGEGRAVIAHSELMQKLGVNSIVP